MSKPCLKGLAALASQLPSGLCSDWEGTNHFEMTFDGKEFFWLSVLDGLDGLESPMDTTLGQRFGLMMDIAEEVGRLRDQGFFKDV